MNKIINRGEVWWINFTPSVGGEIKKTRPAIVISNNYSNKSLNRIQVVPLTSNISKCYPCEAFILINGKKAKAVADQLTTVSKERLNTKIGFLNKDEMLKLGQIIKLQLNLEF